MVVVWCGGGGGGIFCHCTKGQPWLRPSPQYMTVNVEVSDGTVVMVVVMVVVVVVVVVVVESSTTAPRVSLGSGPVPSI